MAKENQDLFVGEFFKAFDQLKAGRAIKRIGWNGFWVISPDGSFKIVLPAVKQVDAIELMYHTTKSDWMVCSDSYVNEFLEMHNNSVKFIQMKNLQEQIAAKKKAEEEKLAKEKAEREEAARAAQMAQIPVQQQKPVSSKRARR